MRRISTSFWIASSRFSIRRLSVISMSSPPAPRRARRGPPFAPPVRVRGERFPDNPFADLEDEPGLLQHAYEAAGWYEPLPRCVPADEGLDRADPPRDQVHLRLIVEHELVLPHGGGEV